MTDSTSGTPPALRTPGLGVWRHTTGNNYALRFKSFNFDAQNVFTGWTLLVTLCAETVGTRFEL